MSLAVLVAIVAIGIILTVLAVHFTGGSKRAAIRDAEHARQVFVRDYPDIPTTTADVTTDGETAFLPLRGGAVGIVHTVGDGFLTRLASSADVASIRLREPATVSLRFRDFTWTGGHFTFTDATATRRVAEVLDPARAKTPESA